MIPTDSQAHNRASGDTYSNQVKSQFFLGVFFLALSGAVSLAGLISEIHSVEVAGAILLPFSFLFLYQWVARANAERETRHKASRRPSRKPFPEHHD